MAIIKVESGGNPLALNVNGSRRLARQPGTRAEAMAWSEWLISRGYSVDMGLAQINSANLSWLGRSIADMFVPCSNITAGARILTGNYADASRRFGDGQSALRAALSAYNTGNHRAGFANGYVAKVTAAAHPGRPVLDTAPPLIPVSPLALTSRPEVTGRAKQLKRDWRDKGNPVSARVYWVKR